MIYGNPSSPFSYINIYILPDVSEMTQSMIICQEYDTHTEFKLLIERTSSLSFAYLSDLL